MVQGDVQEFTDVGQPCRIDAPHRSSQGHRASEGQRRRYGPGRPATRLQHGTIKRRVVCDQELCTAQDWCQLRPNLAKGRLIDHVLPGQPVNPSEGEMRSRRSNEKIGSPHDTIVFRANECDCTRAVAWRIGCLEVDGDEGPWGVLRHRQAQSDRVGALAPIHGRGSRFVRRQLSRVACSPVETFRYPGLV
jgi:hypothetical protein